GAAGPPRPRGARGLPPASPAPERRGPAGGQRPGVPGAGARPPAPLRVIACQARYTTAVMTTPASKVMSPTDGKCVGTTPTYLSWLENSQTDTTTPMTIATGPAQLV